MIPFWSRATEEHVAALMMAKQHQVDEHEAAVERLREAQETGGVTPGVSPETPDQVSRTAHLPSWDGPNAGPGMYGADR